MPFDLKNLGIFWIPRTRNTKTGNIPTAFVLADVPDPEHAADAALASCGAVNCALKDGGCYALSGAIAKYAVVHIDEARESGFDRSIAAALAGRHRRARAVRMTAIGDVAATPGLVSRALDDVARVHEAGLEVIGYTHGWRLSWARSLRSSLRASCDDLADADDAVAAGWAAAVVLPADTDARDRSIRTPEGHRVIVCPAYVKPSFGRPKVTCNTCRLCVVGRTSAVIGFPAHGAEKQAASTRARGRLAVATDAFLRWLSTLDR